MISTEVAPNYDFALEKRLKKLDPKLHKIFSDSVIALQMFLNKYKTIFPNYTDHTMLHSVEVIDFSNKLIAENIEKLNADEIYILLMAAYLHDSGMGITAADYESFKKNLGIGLDADMDEVIRKYHHEFSGEFIKKYGDFFDIPTSEHLRAIIMISRGHRVTNLFDEAECPSNMKMENGNSVCIPFLASVIRLADELDIAIDRNISFLYNINDLTDPISIREFKKHKAIQGIEFGDKAFIMNVKTEDNQLFNAVLGTKDKLLRTLLECVDVVDKRTPYRISQRQIVITRVP